MIQKKFFLAKKILSKKLETTEDVIEQGVSELKLNGKKYHIKVSNPVVINKEKKMRVWEFDLRMSLWVDSKSAKSKKERIYSDYYLLIGQENNRVKKAFLIPSQDVSSSRIRISIDGQSKYHKYAV